MLPKAHRSRRKKPGPRTPWQLRAKYQRARCFERLKPNQIENLAAADAFARWLGTPLNHFVTVHFGYQPNPKRIFESALDRLSKWHMRWGGKWLVLYVWEAIGGFHVHLACHCSTKPNVLHAAINSAFGGCDIDIRARSPGQGMMSYLCKGTDVVTHSKIRGPRDIRARMQGVIPWKRCGTTQNIGKSTREKVGFESKNHLTNCVKTSPRELNASASQRTSANSHGGIGGRFPTSIVSEITKIPLQDTGNIGMSEIVMCSR